MNICAHCSQLISLGWNDWKLWVHVDTGNTACLDVKGNARPAVVEDEE